MLNQIVDDAALQFERDNFEQKDADRQRQQNDLVQPARAEHIAEDIARQRSRRGDIEFMDPGDDAHRPKTINLIANEREASSCGKLTKFAFLLETFQRFGLLK